MVGVNFYCTSECLKSCVCFLSAGAVDLSVDWGEGRVTVTWLGRFQSPPDVTLYYEVSLGTQLGSASIRRWALSTEDTTITFRDARLTSMREYFLSLTAVAYSGHFLTENFMISGAVPMFLG